VAVPAAAKKVAGVGLGRDFMLCRSSKRVSIRQFQIRFGRRDPFIGLVRARRSKQLHQTASRYPSRYPRLGAGLLSFSNHADSADY